MASRNTVGADTAPQLVVKIIGSKLIKYYAEEPKKENVANSDASQESNLPQNIDSKTVKVSPDKEEDLATQTNTMAGGRESSPWPVLKQVPDRNCATAPCQYSSLPCINHKKTPTLRSAPPVVSKLHSCGQGVPSTLMEEEKTEGIEQQNEEKDREYLFNMVREELKHWRKETLKNIEFELQELDSSHCGIVDQYHLTQVFFRHEVPIKLPTLRLLIYYFSNSTYPEEVHYKDLLGLISDAALNEEQQEKIKSEVGSVQHRSEVVNVSDSTHSGGLDHCSDAEIWLQRFKRMEEAMWMCDIHNSGFVDKDKARRLIQNYNLIFNLNLSPLKIDQAIRASQTESQVQLDSLFQNLKEL